MDNAKMGIARSIALNQNEIVLTSGLEQRVIIQLYRDRIARKEGQTHSSQTAIEHHVPF